MHTIIQQQVKATSIGNIAFTVLSTDQEGLVLGNTSKGLFIKISGKWLIFVSTEKFRGPLTINLPALGLSFSQISTQSAVHISSGSLIFPGSGIKISTQESIVWQSPLPDALSLSENERNERLWESTNKIISTNNDAGITFLLHSLLEDQTANRTYFRMQSSLHKKILLLHQQIQRTNRLPSPYSIISLLGAGGGLTPSGDDFIIGLLLAFNRWEKVLESGRRLQKLNQQVVEAAYQKTSQLSANLIECAARGEADERLINYLDWLMSKTPPEANCLNELLNWGNSSGGHVFVGYFVALSLQKNLN
jgi:hypothetical protein